MKLIKYAINGISLFLLLGNILFSLFSHFSILNILSPPSSLVPFFYCIFSSFILYYILQPLHELGHYYVARYYAKNKNCEINFCLNRNVTNCSNWGKFNFKEYILIILSGSISKIIFCILAGYTMYCLMQYLSVQICMFTIIFEIIANCTSFDGKSDLNKIFAAYELKKIPDNEDSDFSKKKTDFFIKKYTHLSLYLSAILFSKSFL